MGTIKESLTFDDILLLPQYSNVLPNQTDISIELTKKIKLKVPFLSSAMDTVTEAKMAIAIAKAGGIGIIHRNLDIKKQTNEITQVKKKKLFVGAAVGTGGDDIKRAKSLVDSGCDLIVIDVLPILDKDSITSGYKVPWARNLIFFCCEANFSNIFIN